MSPLLRRLTLAVLLWSLAHAAQAGHAQISPNGFEQGATAVSFALRQLPQTASVLHITAHPDDEDNALLALLRRRQGLRTGLLTLTRGEGGQNEIGPELFEALGIIRTGELMSMHRYDGVEQFFTRAFEFGYSFSVEETFQKWGKEEILADTVRIIRMFRPTIVLSLPRGGEGGGQHHQASALLAEEAFRAAADPDRFPEQIREGLRPWQAKRLYERYRSRGRRESDGQQDPNVVSIQTGLFEPLIGATYQQLGAAARAMHRCQGMSQISPLPGNRPSTWRLVDAVPQVPGTVDNFFDGLETSLFSIDGLVSGEAHAVPFLHEALSQINETVKMATASFDIHEPSVVAPMLGKGLGQVRELIDRLRTSQLSDPAKYEVVFLLEKKLEDFQRAMNLASSLRMEALVEDGTVVPGEEVKISAHLANFGRQSIALESIELKAPAGWQVAAPEEIPAALSPGTTERLTFATRVASDASPTRPYWERFDPDIDRFQLTEPQHFGRPWSAPSVVVRVCYVLDGVENQMEIPVEYRYEGPWVGGEQRHELMVVPAVSVSVTPEIAILPKKDGDRGVQVKVTATYNGNGPTSAQLRLETVGDWSVYPPVADLSFERESESRSVFFDLKPAPLIESGEYSFTAVAEVGSRTYREGHQFIDYDHIERRVIYRPATTSVRVLDFQVAPDLRVGYVEGVGDHVFEALEQLGVAVDLLSDDDLALSDLSGYDVIVTGVRAYLDRSALKNHNNRLLAWVEEGGTLIVQYNKFEFNDSRFLPDGRRVSAPSPYAPFPAQVSRDRVTDEDAPITILEPDHPVFNFPNHIGASDWENWVQERGLYFLGERSPRYQDLLSTQDPFQYNPGEKRGALVEARYGKGRWLYVGLGLWRQLPAGVSGAYRLLANLVSLPKYSGSTIR